MEIKKLEIDRSTQKLTTGRSTQRLSTGRISSFDIRHLLFHLHSLCPLHLLSEIYNPQSKVSHFRIHSLLSSVLCSLLMRYVPCPLRYALPIRNPQSAIRNRITGHPYHKAAAILLALITLSCSQYGESRRPSSQSTRVTLAQLQDSWQKYLIYYSTRIVVFDPIADDKTVTVHGDWNLIEEADKLSEILSRLELNTRFDPDDILEIRGPGGALFGYMIVASGDLVSVKAVEANTVLLYYSPRRAPDAP